MGGTATPGTGKSTVLCSYQESLGNPEAGSLRLLRVCSYLNRTLGSIPEASFLPVIYSGSVILLLLQTDSCETGRSSLLPGLFVAAQGVRASPKVTTSRHTDGCLSFLTEATFAALQRE